MKNRKEIRIVNPDDKLFELIVKLAKENKRTLGKQAEYMIEQFVKKSDAIS